MKSFCIQGDRPLICKTPVFQEFEDEIEIITIILEYLKQYLPQIMAKKLDCYRKPIKIDPKDIGVVVQKDFGNYLVVLVPVEDNSFYPDDYKRTEESEYVFQIDIQVSEDDCEGSLENLIKLKSGIKTMLVNMDDNIGLNSTIEGFSFDGPFDDPLDNNRFVRQGTYRFSVQDNRFKR